MGKKDIPLQKSFQKLMWKEMASDPEWSDNMDEMTGQLTPGEAWPEEE